MEDIEDISYRFQVCKMELGPYLITYNCGPDENNYKLIQVQLPDFGAVVITYIDLYQSNVGNVDSKLLLGTAGLSENETRAIRDITDLLFDKEKLIENLKLKTDDSQGKADDEDDVPF